MSARNKQTVRRVAAGQGVAADPLGGWCDRIALGLVALLIVWRLITPTEAAAAGETLWVAVLSPVALLCWGLGRYRAGSWTARWGAFDVAVGLLIGGHVLGAGVVLTWGGDGRAALNLLWEWVGIGITVFLVRQLLVDRVSQRPLIQVVLATTVALAGLGLWQHFVGYSQMIEIYDRLEARRAVLSAGASENATRALELEQLDAEYTRNDIPLDPNARLLWEQRLRASQEPLGMFALTNTLAGLLVVVLILQLAAGWNLFRERADWGRLALFLLAAGVVVYCLLLTKSRTGYVGLVAGVSAWGVARLLAGTATVRRLAQLGLMAAAVGGVLTLVAWQTGGLDRLVVLESGKSLRYRLEYWEGTWQAISETASSLVFGCGLGNFRPHYLQFKLPQSSEEIADPHNLLLDVWANGGLIGLAGLVGVLVLAIGLLRRDRAVSPDPSSVAEPQDASPSASGPTAAKIHERVQQPRANPRKTHAETVSHIAISDTSPIQTPLAVGAVLAFVAVFVMGGEGDPRLPWLLLGASLAGLALHWAWPRGALSAEAFGAAAVALVVHLLGAGGIGMPAISQVLLLLVVWGLASEGQEPNPRAEQSRWWSMWDTTSMTWHAPAALLAPAGAGLVLFLGGWFTAAAPVMARNTAVSLGDSELLDRRNPAGAKADYERAASADPWSSEGCERLANLHFRLWSSDPARHDADFAAGLRWQDAAIERNALQSSLYSNRGEWRLRKFEQSRNLQDARAAARDYQQAVDLYPNSSRLQSHLADAQAKAGDSAAALAAARRALALDQLNRQAGHRDKYLPQEKLDLLEQIVQSAGGRPGE